MKISEYAVKNYQFTLVVFVAAMAMGLYSLFNMPRGEDPEFQSPQFFIIAVYPGANPSDMEELVVDPLEKKINELDDIKRVRSDINDGVAVIRVEYKYESDPDEKYQEVVREINGSRGELPADLYSIDIQKVSPTDVNIFQFALVSENASYSTLKNYAEDLEEKLEKVKSLKNVDKWGFPEQNVRIDLDIEKMAMLKIPVNQVISFLQSENVNIPGGSININTKKLNVKTSGNYKELDEIKNTIVHSSGGKIVYLKDIAQVQYNYEDEKHITRLNGHRAVFVTASQKSGQNIFKVDDTVQPLIEKYKSTLPSNIDLITVFDQGESVHRRLSRFGKDFAIAILLVLVTLLPLGFRASLVVMISIPLSLAIGLVLLNVFGYTINQLSIVGMIVALGILVDDSIVVVENIERYLREGYSRLDATIKASSQIGMAILGCTATLIFSFLPLLFLPEGAGDFIRSLPMAVVTTVFASMLVSLTIVPFLSSRLLAEHENAEGNIFMRGLKKLISGSYSKLLEKALARPFITLAITLVIFVGVVSLIPKVGFSLFPASEKPMFMVNIEMPDGTNLYETNRVTAYVEGQLNDISHLRSYAANVGKGNPQVYYNVIQKNESANFAQVFVQLEPETEPEEKLQIIDELREKFKGYPNAKIEVKNFEQGPPQDAPVAIRIFGENLDTLKVLAGRLETIMEQTEGTIYINNPLKVQPTDLKVDINKDKAGMLGIPVSEIDKTVRLGIAGLNIGTLRNDNGDEYNINVTMPKEGATQTFDVFNKLYVNNVVGTPIPLRQVADIKLETSPNQIRHYDKDRYITVATFVKTGYLVGDVNKAVVEKVGQLKFPEGYSYMVAGEQESQSESFGGLGTIILITFFGFVGVLVLEFKTFKSTLIVLSVIPLGIIGAILMLLASGVTFSFTATIGLIALVGIEVKNSILLVDFTNQLREQGMPLDEAIKEAGEIRFVPIVLTSLTAIGGLIPLVIEFNALYSPLALVIIGGLISSTLLSRLVTPVMYKLLPPTIEAHNKKD